MTSSPSIGSREAQLYRARLSSDDFREAAEYLSKVSEARDDIVKRALLTAAIVSYARPFTNNQKRPSNEATGQLGVRLSNLFLPAELELHKRLIALRNEAVAHTAYSRKPVKRLEGSLTGFTMSGKLFDLLNENIDVKLFSSMCDALGGHCHNAMMQLNRQMVELENAHQAPSNEPS